MGNVVVFVLIVSGGVALALRRSVTLASTFLLFTALVGFCTRPGDPAYGSQALYALFCIVCLHLGLFGFAIAGLGWLFRWAIRKLVARRAAYMRSEPDRQ